MVAQRNDHPGQERRARHIDFIQINWALLAGQAYRNFLKHGRGLVIVAESDFLTKPKGILTQIRVSYMNRQSNAFDKVLGGKEKLWVRSYDPCSELLVGFEWLQDQGFSSYRINAISLDSTPKSIYEREPHEPDSGHPAPQP